MYVQYVHTHDVIVLKEAGIPRRKKKESCPDTYHKRTEERSINIQETWRTITRLWGGGKTSKCRRSAAKIKAVNDT